MLTAFGTSVASLICYLAYHVLAGRSESTSFPGPSNIKPIYLIILVPHIMRGTCSVFSDTDNLPGTARRSHPAPLVGKDNLFHLALRICNWCNHLPHAVCALPNTNWIE